jgi:hypothetical protein
MPSTEEDLYPAETVVEFADGGCLLDRPGALHGMMPGPGVELALRRACTPRTAKSH